MVDEEILKLIQELVYKVTGKSGLTYDTDFVQDLSLNSFEIMNLVSEFEDYYDIDIPTREVWHLKQVKDVIEYIKKHQ